MTDKTKRIKAILFDFGGTLDCDGVDWFSRIYKLLCNEVGHIEVAPFRKLAMAAADAIEHISGTETLLLHGTVERILEQLHIRMCEAGLQDKTNWTAVKIAKQFTDDCDIYLKRNLPILAQLSKKYRLACISNNWGNTEGWCKYYGYDQYFEIIVDSALEQSSKPDRKIFEVALERMCLSGDQCIYVGDRFDFDVIGSMNLNYTPVWITAGDYYGETDDHVRPITINTLSQLLEIELLSF